MVVYFSHYPDEVALLDVLLSNKPLFNIFRDAFFRIRTNQNQVAKEQSIEKIGFLILQVFISKKIGENTIEIRFSTMLLLKIKSLQEIHCFRCNLYPGILYFDLLLAWILTRYQLFHW